MSIQAFLDELRNVVDEVSALLDLRRTGSPGIGTIPELEYIVGELSAIDQQITQGGLPPADRRDLASSRIVTDTWPVQDALGERICRLAYLYRKQVEP